MTIDEMIAVMKHFADGGEVEYEDGTGWKRATTPVWDWNSYDYRIKPKAKRKIKLEAWLDDFCELRYFESSATVSFDGWTRLPLLDLETEIED